MVEDVGRVPSIPVYLNGTDSGLAPGGISFQTIYITLRPNRHPMHVRVAAEKCKPYVAAAAAASGDDATG